ncbi:hypothetical protein D3C87_1596410 [compost metagenome]
MAVIQAAIELFRSQALGVVQRVIRGPQRVQLTAFEQRHHIEIAPEGRALFIAADHGRGPRHAAAQGVPHAIHDSLGHQRVIDQFMRLVEQVFAGVTAERQIGIVAGQQMTADIQARDRDFWRCRNDHRRCVFL